MLSFSLAINSSSCHIAYRVRPFDAAESGFQPRPLQRRQENVEHPLERRALGVDVRGQSDQVGREEDPVYGVCVAVVRQQLVPLERPHVPLAVDQAPVLHFQVNLCPVSFRPCACRRRRRRPRRRQLIGSFLSSQKYFWSGGAVGNARCFRPPARLTLRAAAMGFYAGGRARPVQSVSDQSLVSVPLAPPFLALRTEKFHEKCQPLVISSFYSSLLLPVISPLSIPPSLPRPPPPLYPPYPPPLSLPPLSHLQHGVEIGSSRDHLAVGSPLQEVVEEEVRQHWPGQRRYRVRGDARRFERLVGRQENLPSAEAKEEDGPGGWERLVVSMARELGGGWGREGGVEGLYIVWKYRALPVLPCCPPCASSVPPHTVNINMWQV